MAINTSVKGCWLLAWSSVYMEDHEAERLVREKHGSGWELSSAGINDKCQFVWLMKKG